MNGLWFGIATLAVYRVAHMISREEGPMSIFVQLRAHLGGRHWIGRGMHCPLCVSFWLSWGAALLLPWVRWEEYLLLAFGLAGAVLVTHRWLDRA